MVDIRELRGGTEQDRSYLYHDLARDYLRVAGMSQHEISVVFSRLGNPDFWSAEYADPNGNEWGMSTMDAIRCLVDIYRTGQLVEGIFQTIEGLRLSGKENITAIDAGTGTGILAMSLVAAGCGQVYALEINPGTAEVTQEFVNGMGLSNNIQVVNCDATKVELSGLKADILVSENLAAGLFDEAQFHIIRHLSQYLTPEAKIIPFAATNVVSLGTSTWQDQSVGITGYRKLHDLEKVSETVPFVEVVSTVGMQVPNIDSVVKVEVNPSTTRDINNLLIATRFAVNDEVGGPIIEDDSAMFLGESYVVKLPRPVVPENGVVDIKFSYTAGRPIILMKTEVHGNNIFFHS